MLRKLAGAVIALAICGPLDTARAEVFLENMTSPEVGAAIAEGTRTVIIPTGGTEQNGAVMVLGKHNIRVRALSGRIAEALGDAMVAPVIAYVPEGEIDPPTGHMPFPGSITVPPEIFAANVEWAARSMRQAGFETIVLLGDSGWNQAPMAEVAEKLNREWGGGVLFADAYYDTNAVFAAWLEEQGFERAGVHAGLADTAMMLAVDPGAVRDKGVATEAMGARGVEMFVARTVEQVRAFRGD
ncbi:creatininase family protein [Rhodalgimonas zhirmunskyi]|uniref:Creatininase family protein n=1 Tax=Rhodalgimonas zhirmunskyi TaxID=2964767 RepID=A0AAJ1X6W5_9RHOB|nr:creatininase family protein [Rhodoalgimonas zhirmunskyi]MDQ2095901.1 creatininase family protein [Rhodoalgimonas zhirmunskyi]